MKRLITVIVAVILVIGGYFSYNIYNKPEAAKNIVKVDEIPSDIINIEKQGLAPKSYINVKVIKVVDGDTIDVNYNEKRYRVRLLDIDTPESVKEGVPVQAYSKEAAGFCKDLLLNKSVKLVFSEGLKDKYDRLLAYVVLNDNTLLNALLVSSGYARAEIISPNIDNADFFYKLEDKAVKQKVGLWGLPMDKQPFVKDGTGHYIPRYWTDEKAS